MIASEFWFLLSFGLIAAELFLGGTIVLLFASLSALTIGFLVSFAVIDVVDQLHQALYFFLLTSIYSLVLWKPVKKVMRSEKLPQYSNIVGRDCKVTSHELVKGEIGKVEWSGTIFNARIVGDSKHEKFLVGDILKIIAIEENTLYVNKGE